MGLHIISRSKSFDLFPRTDKGKNRCVLWQKHALINSRERPQKSDINLEQSSQRDCGTSVESNESVAAAFAIATRFFDDPTRALCFAASIGGDTDTIAAITGAMLGAWHGVQGFDAAMLDQVLSQLAEDNHLDLKATVSALCALRDAGDMC